MSRFISWVKRHKTLVIIVIIIIVIIGVVISIPIGVLIIFGFVRLLKYIIKAIHKTSDNEEKEESDNEEIEISDNEEIEIEEDFNNVLNRWIVEYTKMGIDININNSIKNQKTKEYIKRGFKFNKYIIGHVDMITNIYHIDLIMKIYILIIDNFKKYTDMIYFKKKHVIPAIKTYRKKRGIIKLTIAQGKIIGGLKLIKLKKKEYIKKSNKFKRDNNIFKFKKLLKEDIYININRLYNKSLIIGEKVDKYSIE